MKTILVTGGAGFIGSAFVRDLVLRQPEMNFVVLDRLTYAGNLNNLLSVSDEPNYHFVRGDIADDVIVQQTLAAYEVDIVVNFAAESHVDRSILSPGAFIQTDVVGVYTLLEASLAAGIERFVQVSTDEVYGDVEEGYSQRTTPFCRTAHILPARREGNYWCALIMSHMVWIASSPVAATPMGLTNIRRNCSRFSRRKRWMNAPCPFMAMVYK